MQRPTLNALSFVLCALTFTGLAPSAQAAPNTAAKPAQPNIKRFALHSNIVDGKMVYVDSQGTVNPTLHVAVGDTVEIELQSDEGAEHDLVIDELGVASPKFSGSSKPKIRFTATRSGTFTYYCSIPGHRQIGMWGTIQVAGPAQASHSDGHPTADAGLALYTPTAVAPARRADPAAVRVAADPNQVPPAITAPGPQKHQVRLETIEVSGQLDDGTSFTYWTFNRQVPGPMLRVRKGDTVQLTLANAKDSKAIHSIDLHAVTGGHGGGAHTQVAPGQEKTITFKAMHPGLFVYHCATPLVPQHIAAGMYGMILVEPEQGLPPVDREFYVMQGDMYTQHPIGAKVHQEVDLQKMSDEIPSYYVFNGAVGALTQVHKMQAQVGDTVRVYFGVGGPNKISSFHIIGEVFDKVYTEAALNNVATSVQTTKVAPGGAAIVELKTDYPGSYLLVDHALSRVGKGAVGVLEVSGTADPSIYQSRTP